MRFPNRLRALILLAVVLDLRGLSWLARALTREPRVEQTEIDGVPVEVVRPGGPGPWPAWLFVNGAHPERRAEPVVTRLSRGLARAGYIVFVPDVPGLGEGTITSRTLESTFAVADAAAASPEVLGRRVALIGASTGAGLALVTAARPDAARIVSVLAAVAPFADLERMVCLATTRAYSENGRFESYEVTALHRTVVARSLLAAIPHAAERERLLASVAEAEREGRDPIELLPQDVESAEARAIVGVLANEQPERFAELYGALPRPLLELLTRLSPVGVGANIVAPVELVVPPSDVYFPMGEAQALANALPNVQLTVTATLDHTRPRLSLAHFRSLVRFERFVMRGIRMSSRS